MCVRTAEVSYGRESHELGPCRGTLPLLRLGFLGLAFLSLIEIPQGAGGGDLQGFPVAGPQLLLVGTPQPLIQLGAAPLQIAGL